MSGHIEHIESGSLKWQTPPDTPIGQRQLEATLRYTGDQVATPQFIHETAKDDLPAKFAWDKLLAGDYGAIADYVHPAPEPDGSGHLVVATGGVLAQSRATSDLNSALEVWDLYTMLDRPTCIQIF